jgi:hypothetical protein
MDDPFRPSTVLLCKLGSALVHAQEASEPGAHPFDVSAFKQLSSDSEVVEWLGKMDALGLMPKKRNA